MPGTTGFPLGSEKPACRSTRLLTPPSWRKSSPTDLREHRGMGPAARPLAALYCRVSTGKQEDEGTSLASQEERCRAYAAEHGYAVGEGQVYREPARFA